MLKGKKEKWKTKQSLIGSENHNGKSFKINVLKFKKNYQKILIRLSIALSFKAGKILKDAVKS